MDNGVSAKGGAPLEKLPDWLWVALVAAWAVLIAGLAGFEVMNDREEMLGLAAAEAKASFQKDLVYRRWASGHGGVYVPPTDNTPPNPYLAHIPDRDVVTTSGKKLTLVNPAYMTRQVHELSSVQYGVKGHITSLNPLRPENLPDEWEAAALKAFEKGAEETVDEVMIGGKPHFRFMRRMMVEKPCLKCHASQGYVEGQVRGGISVSVPLESYLEVFASSRQRSLSLFSAVWLVGVAGIALMRKHIRGQYGNLAVALANTRLSEEKFSKAFYLSPLMKVISTLDDVSLLEANEAFLKTLGYSRQEALGKSAMALGILNPADREEILRQVRERERAEVPAMLIRTRYGRELIVRYYGESISLESGDRLLSTLQDITDLKQKEEEILKAQELLTTTGKLAKVGGWSMELPGMRLAWTEEVYAIHGVDGSYVPTVDKAIGFYTPECREKIKEAFRLAVDEGVPFDLELEIITAGGARRKVQALGRRVEKNGVPVAVTGAFRDITEQKKAEEEKIKLQGQLLQAQKMEAVGRLAGGVAHDFNNMLGVIIGNSEMLMQKLPADSTYCEEVQEILSAASRSADITRQLLAFARKQTIVPRVLDLNETIEPMLKMIRRLIGEDIKLVWKPSPDLWKIKIDPSQLDQLLANLTTNSRDAIRDVGTITIETYNGRVDLPNEENPLEGTPGDYVVLAVTDTGMGIDPAKLQSIFDPFFTTKELGQGTGLGLATVDGIVKQNGGFINVYSELGQGTSFKLYLPRVSLELSSEKEKSTKAPGGSERLLIVEDEEANLKIARKYLESLGYTVFAAPSPREALKIISTPDSRVDLMVTDVVLPEKNGRDLALECQAMKPALKVLYMSGYTANVIADRGVLDESTHFIQKPYSLDDFGRKIRQVLDGK